MLTGATAKYNYYRGHTLTTAPTSEPITLTEVKAQLNIDLDTDDTLLTMYITAARQYAEQMTGLALIDQTWTLTMDGWPGQNEDWWDGVRDGHINMLRTSGRPSNILIPRYPLQSVSTITADGVAVTIADTFIVDDQQKPGRLVIKSGATWPVVLENANGVVIEYVAGYGDAADVPMTLKVALLQMVASLYTFRGDGCTAEDAWKKTGAAAAFDAYKVRGL